MCYDVPPPQKKRGEDRKKDQNSWFLVIFFKMVVLVQSHVCNGIADLPSFLKCDTSILVLDTLSISFAILSFMDSAVFITNKTNNHFKSI